MGLKYSSNSSSGYNSSPPADDGSVTEANKVKWATIKTKLSDPIKSLADTINSELATHFDNGPTAIATETTLGATHYNQVIEANTTSNLTLSDASSLTAGWYCDIHNIGSTSFTLARATASNTIDSVSSDVTIYPTEAIRVIVNAGADGFLTQGRKNNLFNMPAGADVASAATIDLTAATGNSPRITGTTATSAVTMNTGQWALVVADAAWPLTYNATTNKISGGADYTLTAGDMVLYNKDLSGVVHGNIIKADGTSLGAPTADQGSSMVLLDTQTASASASLDFTSSIDSTYDSYVFYLSEIVAATDGTWLYMKVSRDAGSSWEATNYNRAYTRAASNNSGAFEGAAGGTAMRPTGESWGNGAGKSGSGHITLAVPSSTATYKKFYGQLAHNNTGTDDVVTSFVMSYYSTNAINGVQFYFNPGNITSGTIGLYGVKKS